MGQRDLGDGSARPLRDAHVELDEDKFLPIEHHAAVKRIKDAGAWVATVKKLPQMWQDQVVSAME
ncbi:hypothetical protein ACFV30_27210 [Streptomyces sp. NPDC059752]|uniref:hypothetical protein n=1 Tax=Streptomyces sp. NPDC059752 TaxID=3346932 RepID=UPI003647FBFC